MTTDFGPAPSATTPRPLRLGRTPNLAYRAAVLGLIGLNAWWAWEDRPLPDLPTVGSWIAQDAPDSSGRRPLLDQAERALRGHLRRSPHHGEARILLAKALAARGDHLECARQLHRVPDWWPDKAEARYREGQFFMAVGHARDAEAAWLACIADDPLHPTPPDPFTGSVHELVQLYVLEGRKPEVRKLLWQAIERTAPAHHTSILILRTWVELYKDQPELSADKLRKYVATTPDDFDAMLALARLELGLNHLAAATRLVDAVLKARPNEPPAWRDRLAILKLRGDDTGLRATLAQLPPSCDQDPDIWKYRGLIREQDRDFRGAAEAYRRVVDLSPADEEGYFKLAHVQDVLGQRDQAAEHRRRYKAITDARRKLLKFYDVLLDARKDPTQRAADRTKAIAEMPALWEALGWPREAQAWKGLTKPA
jgi:tetratricopeptide (TPR) repeat protein